MNQEQHAIAPLSVWLGRSLAAGVAAAGVWALLSRPLHQELSSVRRAAGEAGASALALENSRPELEQRESALALARQRGARALALSAAGEDRKGCYDAFTHIAESCGVRIDRIEPQPGRGAGGDAVLQASQCSVEIVGRYARVLEFLSRVESSLGLTRVVSVTLEAAEAPPRADAEAPVRAVILSEHLTLRHGQPIKQWLAAEPAAGQAPPTGE